MLAIAARGEPTDSFGVRKLIGRRTLALVPLFFVTFFLVLWIGWLLLLAGAWSTGDDFPKIDYSSFWSASSLALDGHAADAYDRQTIGREQLQLPGDDRGFHPWRNPPIFFFFVLPLSLLPFAASLAAWAIATGGPLLAAVRRISSDRTVLTLALAFPATGWNLVIGQNGFLTAGLLAWGVLLLRERPVLAGALLGLIAYKPQFLPLVFVALLASNQRSALISAASCIGVLSFISLALFGSESWEGFVAWAFRSSDSIYSSSEQIEKMQSVSALLILMSVPALLTQVSQVAVALASAAFVFWLWRGDAAYEYKAAGLALAMLFASPYSYHYDMTLLGLAVLWLGLRFQAEGWRPWDTEVLIFAWLAPILTIFAAAFLHVTIGPLAVALMLVILLRRVIQINVPPAIIRSSVAT